MSLCTISFHTELQLQHSTLLHPSRKRYGRTQLTDEAHAKASRIAETSPLMLSGDDYAQCQPGHHIMSRISTSVSDVAQIWLPHLLPGISIAAAAGLLPEHAPCKVLTRC